MLQSHFCVPIHPCQRFKVSFPIPSPQSVPFYPVRRYLGPRIIIISLFSQHWQQLARPQFGGFLESRPGIMPFALQAQRQRIANIRGGGLAGPMDETEDYRVFSDLDDDDLYSLSGSADPL